MEVMEQREVRQAAEKLTPRVWMTLYLLSLIVTISCRSSFQRQTREAVGKNVLLWPVFEGGIATAAVW